MFRLIAALFVLLPNTLRASEYGNPLYEAKGVEFFGREGFYVLKVYPKMGARLQAYGLWKNERVGTPIGERDPLRAYAEVDFQMRAIDKFLPHETLKIAGTFFDTRNGRWSLTSVMTYDNQRVLVHGDAESENHPSHKYANLVLIVGSDGPRIEEHKGWQHLFDNIKDDEYALAGFSPELRLAPDSNRYGRAYLGVNTEEGSIVICVAKGATQKATEDELRKFLGKDDKMMFIGSGRGCQVYHRQTLVGGPPIPQIFIPVPAK